ncbi:reverse transcriptase domain-containing protein [Tanacetum coccineum]
MSTYLKNIAGYKPNQLKNKSFDDIHKLFDKAMKRVNTFVNMDTELVEGTEMKESSKKAEVMEESSKRAEVAQESNSKRAEDELQQENAKKQKGDDDQEAAKMKELMKIVPDEEEVAIDAIPLATKPPSIGRIVGIKRLLDDLRVTAAKVRVTAAKQNLVLFSKLNEKYAK